MFCLTSILYKSGHFQYSFLFDTTVFLLHLSNAVIKILSQLVGLLSFLISLIAISFRGLGDRRSKAFREKYSRIGDFRALCSEVCFVALTATATLVVEKEVAKQLQMSPYKVIRRSPEKCNIR